MKEDSMFKMVLMKMEIKLALEIFRKRFKKIPNGIQKIYENIMLSNDFTQVEREYSRFFGYVKKSKKAKEKWENLE